MSGAGAGAALAPAVVLGADKAADASNPDLTIAPMRLEELIVDREHVKGAADKVKGCRQGHSGKSTGDPQMQAEGKTDKAKGPPTARDAKDTRARDALAPEAALSGGQVV